MQKYMRKNLGKANVETFYKEDPKMNLIKKDVLNLVFLSRICPQKNLMGAVRCLSKIDFEVGFTIYGPEEDSKYGKKCKRELGKLPPNIHCSYKGDIPSEQIQEML